MNPTARRTRSIAIAVVVALPLFLMGRSASIDWPSFPQQLVNGIVSGSVYALIALGYTMVYGVLRLINFAHGDVFMLGAFFAYYVAGWMGVEAHPAILPVIAVFLISMTACALVGVTIERFAYRPLRNAPRLTALITAIGVSLLLEYGGQLVFGTGNKPFPNIVPLQKVVDTGRVAVTNRQVLVVAVSLLIMVGLQLVVQRTKVGKAMRAISTDTQAASLMGIATDSVISFTFALGSALAAAGGILFALYNPSIDPLMGIKYGLVAFTAAVVGGIGNIPGAMLGGMLLGLSETAIVVVRKSEYLDAIAFTLLIIVLLFRPSGLLGRFEPEKV